MTMLRTQNLGLTLLIFLATVAGLAPSAQSTKEQSAFEVASIRPAAIAGEGGEGNSRSQIETAADSLTMRNIDLNEMIVWAFGLQPYQLAAPGTASDRYDVRARADDRVPVSELKRMLQDLLAKRFKLQVHSEQRKTSVYELIVAKGGPRLPKDKSETLPPSFPKESLPRVVDGDFVFSNVSMGEFAQQLTELRGIDLPVVDRTEVQGVYDVTLKSAAKAILDPQGTSLLTLIQEQLGLKLVSAKDPVEVVVVDHAEKPSAN
jgi:uncharacterized protein (TIGR03435 family)